MSYCKCCFNGATVLVGFAKQDFVRVCGSAIAHEYSILFGDVSRSLLDVSFVDLQVVI